MSHPDDIKNAAKILEVLSSRWFELIRSHTGIFALELVDDNASGESITACLIAAGLMESEVDDA